MNSDEDQQASPAEGGNDYEMDGDSQEREDREWVEDPLNVLIGILEEIDGEAVPDEDDGVATPARKWARIPPSMSYTMAKPSVGCRKAHREGDVTCHVLGCAVGTPNRKGNPRRMPERIKEMQSISMAEQKGHRVFIGPWGTEEEGSWNVRICDRMGQSSTVMTIDLLDQRLMRQRGHVGPKVLGHIEMLIEGLSVGQEIELYGKAADRIAVFAWRFGIPMGVAVDLKRGCGFISDEDAQTNSLAALHGISLEEARELVQ